MNFGIIRRPSRTSRRRLIPRHARYFAKGIERLVGQKDQRGGDRKIVGKPSARLTNDLISSIAEKNAEKGLSSIRVAAEYNVDMNVFAKLILRKLRAVLLLRYAPAMREEMKSDFSEEDFAFLNECAVSAKAVNSATLSEFLGAYQKIDHSYISQIPLELALIKITSNEQPATNN